MTWVSYAQSLDLAEPGNRVLGGAQLSAPIAQGVQGVMPCSPFFAIFWFQNYGSSSD